MHLHFLADAAMLRIANKKSKVSAKAEVLEKTTNPWLEVRKPLPDTSYPERDRPESNLWLGCLSVLNNDLLKELTETVRVFDYLNFPSAFSLAFGQQVPAGEGCLCKRVHLHTHFIIRVIGEVKRDTAYQMACVAFQKLQLEPEDYYKAFSYLATVHQMELLVQTGMICQLQEDSCALADQLENVELIKYSDLK